MRSPQEFLIRHLCGTAPPSFEVEDVIRCVRTAAPNPPAADTFPVEGRPGSRLAEELRWYLEEFLDYPFHPETERAERVLTALQKWGQVSFESLLGPMGPNTIESGLRVVVESDSLQVLSWPWETLTAPTTEPLGPRVNVIRRLATLAEAPPSPPDLSQDPLDVLLVTARPDESDETTYRAIARPLIRLVTQGLPIRVHLLRPPSLEQLVERLQERRWHVLHFDVHGSFRQHRGRRIEGHLDLEDEHGSLQPVASSTLRKVFRRHPVPIVVLNACQSANLTAASKDVYASVAATLLAAGATSVVAMAYALYRSAAEIFVPTFYRHLVETRDITKAMFEGRRALYEKPERLSLRGRFDLHDWFIPVLYQNPASELRLAVEPVEPSTCSSPLDPKATDAISRHDNLVGRDRAFLHLDRALRRPEGAVLVHGLTGVGKTTLAQHFLAWLQDTDWLEVEGIWLSTLELGNAEMVFQHLGLAMIGHSFSHLQERAKLDRLIETLRLRRHFVVWDDFEALPTLNRHHLQEFVLALRGGASKFLLISSDCEEWLQGACTAIGLQGLEGEERWQLCEQILANCPELTDRGNPQMVRLLDYLDGHALAMQVVLAQLPRHDPSDLLERLQHQPRSLGHPDAPEEARLLAVLRLTEESVSSALRPLFVPLALHEKIIDGQLFKIMVEEVNGKLEREDIDQFFSALSKTGMLLRRGSSLYDLHPSLTGYLRSTVLSHTSDEAQEAWARIFVSLMGSLAYELAPRPPHRQRGAVRLYQSNFLSALRWATQLGMLEDQIALLNCLAIQAYHLRVFSEASRSFELLAELSRNSNQPRNEAAFYHRLGMIAQERRDFTAAETWFRRSLTVERAAGDDSAAAITFHHLGMVAQQQHRLDEAKQHFQDSLERFTQSRDEHHAAASRLHIGIVAQEQGYLDEAVVHYRAALKTAELIGDPKIQASSLHQLSVTNHLAGKHGEALRFARRALTCKHEIGDELGTASTYHQLGLIAQAQGDLDTAQRSFVQALRITEEQNAEHIAVRSYHHLGRISHQRKDYASSEHWCRKALRIEEATGDEMGSAASYHLLGMALENQGRFEEAEQSYERARELKEKLHLERELASTWFHLGGLAERRQKWRHATSFYRRALELEERFGEEAQASITCHHLGRIAEEMDNLDEAEEWFRRALGLAEKQGAHASAAASCTALGLIAKRRDRRQEALVWMIQALQFSFHGEDEELSKQSCLRLREYHDTLDYEEQKIVQTLLKEAGLENVRAHINEY